MVKDTNAFGSLSKQSSSNEKKSSPSFEENEDYHDDEEEQTNVEKVKNNIKKEKTSLRGRPKDDKTANRAIVVTPKQNFDQDNLNCIFFKYRLDVMSTDTIRSKYYNGQYNSSAEQPSKEVDNSIQENEDDGTEKKRKRRQKSVEDLQPELKLEYLQKKNKKMKESHKQKYDQQTNIQYYNEAFKPLDLQLDRGLTEIEQLMVDSATQFKKVFECYFSENFAQMKNEYGFFDEMMIDIIRNQAADNQDIVSRAERSGCTVIPPFFWKDIADIFFDTYNSRLSPYHSQFFQSS